MDSITVGLGERSYPIFFGEKILADIGSIFNECSIPGSLVIVTNPTVGAYYLDVVTTALRSSGRSVHVITIPDGEPYKSAITLEQIYDSLIDADIDRGGCIVALGGGVAGDIAGYAAATYLRGILFVQLPTSLLAQVDSSVGGKTGINHKKGKNLIGAFYQPRLVAIDVATLQTLPKREYVSGLAEVVKYGVVLDKGLFTAIEASVDRVLALDSEVLLPIIKRCCQLKAEVVEKDERESGLRAVLNYGHTFGHAIETMAGYGRYTHGEAVAVGMAMAARFSAEQGHCSLRDVERIISLLESLGLSTQWPDLPVAELSRTLQRDKKVRDSGLTFVCNKGIGGYHMERITNLEQLVAKSGIGG